MEFKGTKGKWEVYNPNHIGCINVSFGKNDGFTGYVELWHHHFENKEEAKANALLISKAPEMLEFLQSIVSDYENGLIEDIEDLAIRSEQLIKEAIEL